MSVLWRGVSGRFLGPRVLGLTLALALSACAAIPRPYSAPPPEHHARAEIRGFERIRFWGDEAPPFIEQTLVEHYARDIAHPNGERRYDILALSGGADDGAYGAGFLAGWTARGDRPSFRLVTGVSTGALIAPFAFLGPEYDDSIRRFYTETSAADIFVLKPIAALLGASALADTAPLRRILADEVDAELVAKIAAAHRAGRWLLIGTTNLDAQRQVIWNIGRIADSGHPGAAALIREILLASASIPGAFPPVRIDVEIDGRRHQELHVDGGVTHEIFAYPPAIDVGAITADAPVRLKRTMWLIRNTKIAPEYHAVEPGVGPIAARAISTLIKYQGRGDLIALERLAHRDGFDFRLTYVPESFSVQAEELFDPTYMRALYQTGYAAGLSGSAWKTSLDQLIFDGGGKGGL